MNQIVTTVRLPEDAEAFLTPFGPVHGPDDWHLHLRDATAAITLVNVRVDGEFLRRSPKLRIVANAGVGYDNVDLAACAERGVAVTNTPDVLTDATADLAIALLLATVRRLPQAEASLRAGEFHGWGFWDHLGGDVTGATVGIYGMGRIGQAFARRLAGFGVSIQYYNRSRVSPERERDLGATWVDERILIGTSDILSLHAPYTPDTHHLLDAESLARMKPGSYRINTARGAMVDEEALVAALVDGPLAGAGLDVYEHEPRLHPRLLDLPNVVLLPHIGSATPRTRRSMAMLACRNVAAVLGGGSPLTPVLG
jgi:glyoxylate reductase